MPYLSESAYKLGLVFVTGCSLCILLFVYDGPPVLSLFGTLVLQSQGLAADIRGQSWQVGVTQNCSSPAYGRKGFFSVLRDVPWDRISSLDERKRSRLQERFLLDLVPSLVAEPTIPINESCEAPRYERMPHSQLVSLCSSNPAFEPNRTRETPAHIGILNTFGFEADVLEIFLREVYPHVDAVFLAESSFAHRRPLSRKPLIWQHLKIQPRFSIFTEKVINFIVDESEALNEQRSDNIWTSESLQSSIAKKRVLEWNAKTSVFSQHDFIGVNHVDQIPSGLSLHLLRNCVLKRNVNHIESLIWFPWSRIDSVYTHGRGWNARSEAPYAFSGTQFHTFASYQRDGDFGMAPKGAQGYILGGMHASDCPYAPFLLTKRYVTCTECMSIFDTSAGDKRSSIVRLLHSPEELEQMLTAKPERHVSNGRLISVSEALKRKPNFGNIHHVPWFLACNPRRYPGWTGHHDDRVT